MIRAVLLDLDGTLVDALTGWGLAFEDALALGRARYPQLERLGGGLEAHIEVFRPLVHAEHRDAGGGEWSRDFLRRGFAALLEIHARPDSGLADEMFALYEASWPRHIELYPEVPALLEELQRRYRLAIVSNGLGWEQRQKIAPLGLDTYFEAVAISGELGVRKPAKAIFEHALGALGVSPEEAVHVGDDVRADIGGARAAGLAAGVWVNRHGRLLAEDGVPQDLLPDIELPDLEHLSEALEAL